MNSYDKPRLIDKAFLKKFVAKKTTQKNINLNKFFSFLKNNFIVLLFIGGMSYFFYYRYNLVKIKQEQKRIEEERKQQQEQQIRQLYLQQQIMKPQVQKQTRFIPEDQQYATPRQQQPYLESKTADVNNYILENSVNPINYDQSYFYENKEEINEQRNPYDYSLKAQSIKFMTPQYIGHNFAPSN